MYGNAYENGNIDAIDEDLAGSTGLDEKNVEQDDDPPTTRLLGTKFHSPLSRSCSLITPTTGAVSCSIPRTTTSRSCRSGRPALGCYQTPANVCLNIV